MLQSHRHGLAAITLLAWLTIASASATAQVDPPALATFELRDHDSGNVIGRDSTRSVVWSDVIHVPGASTIRLYFDVLNLATPPGDLEPSELRITSLHDGGRQTLDATAALQWGFTSAWFNGDTVLLELIADATAPPSRVRLSHAMSARPDRAQPRSICGDTDDRLPSADPRIGRVVPNGCTAWLFDDANHCLLTAGHCVGDGFEIIEFNYPMSNSSGVWQHAHPDDQYIVDASSLQAASQGIGNDWAYFGCLANTNTGATPYAAQQSAFTLAPVVPPALGQMIRITGNGTTDSTVPAEFHRAQKTHTGELISNSGNSLVYATDTTGGNSGSPIIDETTGLVIGIHTHGGCTSGGGGNAGTSILNTSLQNALANPIGVCGPPQPGIAFDFPSGAPVLFAPAGDTIAVQVTPMHGATLMANSVVLHLDAGSGQQSIVMTEAAPDIFTADVAAMQCSTEVSYYFSAAMQTASRGGTAMTSPADAPKQAYAAIAGGYLITAIENDGATDGGWNVVNTSVLIGGWERGVPVGGGDRGDPRTDFDGNGLCWLTGKANGNTDLDGGPTRLVSPTIDLSDFDDPRLRYARWFYTDTPNEAADADRLVIELSDNNGASWSPLEVITTPETWTHRSIRMADHIALTDSVRIRFSVFDVAGPSIVEAAVDAMHVFDVECSEPPVGDINADGVVDLLDLLAVLDAWGSCDAPCPPSCPADIASAIGSDGDCTVDLLDLLAMLKAWGT